MGTNWDGNRIRNVRCRPSFEKAVVRLLKALPDENFGSLVRKALIQAWPEFFENNAAKEELQQPQEGQEE